MNDINAYLSIILAAVTGSVSAEVPDWAHVKTEVPDMTSPVLLRYNRVVHRSPASPETIDNTKEAVREQLLADGKSEAEVRDHLQRLDEHYQKVNQKVQEGVSYEIQNAVFGSGHVTVSRQETFAFSEAGDGWVYFAPENLRAHIMHASKTIELEEVRFYGWPDHLTHGDIGPVLYRGLSYAIEKKDSSAPAEIPTLAPSLTGDWKEFEQNWTVTSTRMGDQIIIDMKPNPDRGIGSTYHLKADLSGQSFTKEVRTGDREKNRREIDGLAEIAENVFVPVSAAYYERDSGRYETSQYTLRDYVIDPSPEQLQQDGTGTGVESWGLRPLIANDYHVAAYLRYYLAEGYEVTRGRDLLERLGIDPAEVLHRKAESP